LAIRLQRGARAATEYLRQELFNGLLGSALELIGMIGQNLNEASVFAAVCGVAV
jgi:hypothetical protein